MYNEKHRITYYDLDMAGRMKISALLRMVHIAADIDATRLGIGFSEMSRLNMTFILQRFALRMARMPEYNEVVQLRTWPDSVARGTFLRKGDMRDENGTKIMEWTSLWILFDTAERKILKPTVLFDAVPEFKEAASGTDYGILPERIILPDSCEEFSRYTHTVRFSEVDTNIHMNNSIYGDLINNALGGAKNWREMQLNYTAETRLDDEIDVAAYRDRDTFYVKGVSGERMSFAARVITAGE